MSNITNENAMHEIYEKIVEIKKRRLELSFMPSENRAKNYATQINQMRKELSQLKRQMREKKMQVISSSNVVRHEKETLNKDI